MALSAGVHLGPYEIQSAIGAGGMGERPLLRSERAEAARHQSGRPTERASCFDVSADGRRFLRAQPVEPDPPANQINVVMNWLEELKRLVPPR